MDRTAGAIDPVSRTLLTQLLVSNHDGKMLLPGRAYDGAGESEDWG